MNGIAQCKAMDIQTGLKEINSLVDIERSKLDKEDRSGLMQVGFKLKELLVLAGNLKESINSYE